MMKLLDVQVFANGLSGWRSDVLTFGVHITQLYGKNGCGKTPIVQSIMFCLGYPCIFRNDIYDKCNYAILRVEISTKIYTIKRVYSTDLDVEVTEPNGNRQVFLNESDYSKYVFEQFDLSTEKLVTTNNKLTQPYLSTIIPIFYLDQDEGYSEFYCPPKNFIKDQFSEMVRMIFRLPAKNSFDVKKEKIRAKERLEYLDKQVEIQSRAVNAAKESLPVGQSERESLVSQISGLEIDLENLKKSGSNHDESISVFDKLIATHKAEHYRLSVEIDEIKKRNSGINKIVHEINLEIETLNLNEEARRVFLSFNEICSASGCQLFSSSSDSYSKNLLYLRDQIKDLQRNSDIDSIRVQSLKEQSDNLEKMIEALVIQRNNSVNKSEISALVDAISIIKNSIFELQSNLSEIDKYLMMEKRHYEILKDRDDALNHMETFSSSRSLIPEIIGIKSALREKIIEWLDVLNTNNVSRNITFENDFTPILGSEKISQLKGSTRTRAVLAFHAALFELISRFNRPNFSFLVLDTPKQHEIHIEDLDRYILALKKLCKELNVQVLFSTTEYHYAGDEFDHEWNPKYPGEKQLMFLQAP